MKSWLPHFRYQSQFHIFDLAQNLSLRLRQMPKRPNLVALHLALKDNSSNSIFKLLTFEGL